jgi:hypothetical protein
MCPRREIERWIAVSGRGTHRKTFRSSLPHHKQQAQSERTGVVKIREIFSILRCSGANSMVIPYQTLGTESEHDV